MVKLFDQAAAQQGTVNTTCVAEGKLCSCNPSNVLQDPQTWLEEHGYDSFDHAYLYTLFLGQDARGNMLPVRQLRDRYSQQRQDVYPKQDEQGSSDDDEDAQPSAD